MFDSHLRKSDALSLLCNRHRVRRILDLGCADPETVSYLANRTDLDYLGVAFGDEIVKQNTERFPNRKFLKADLDNIENLNVDPPDLVVCFDLLSTIHDAQNYDRLCEFMFNCGAKAAVLTCTVDAEENGAATKPRNFWKEANRLGLGYVHKVEQTLSNASERIISFDLCEPSVSNGPTEIVYVCSPDREDQLFNSLATFLNSGTSFDRVVIFCIGQRPAHWKFSDTRIVVKQVPNLFEDFFLGNKVYLCTRMAQRVIFLDTDTFILRPLDFSWQGKDADFLARPDGAYYHPTWNAKGWGETLRRVGATQDVPMFNTGVMIFQNQSQRRIQTDWASFMSSFLKGELPFPLWENVRLSEQFGLALAVGSANLRFSLLRRTDHAFGWREESNTDDIVFHTSNFLFIEYAHHFGSDSLALHQSGFTDNGTDIQPTTQPDKTVAELSDRVRHLRQALNRLKNSTAFALGTMLISIVGSMGAALRLNKRACIENWAEIEKSFQLLRRKRK